MKVVRVNMMVNMKINMNNKNGYLSALQMTALMQQIWKISN